MIIHSSMMLTIAPFLYFGMWFGLSLTGKPNPENLIHTRKLNSYQETESIPGNLIHTRKPNLHSKETRIQKPETAICK